MDETKLPSVWKLVPVEPTEAMKRALFTNLCEADDEAKIIKAVIAAAPAAPATWSSATAPGPDGMQHCIAVPGMPSAARDAALEEACEALHTWLKYPTEACAIVRALKSEYAPNSIAGPVAGAAEKVDDLSDWPSLDECAPLIRAKLGWVPGEPNISTNAPVQQAAPSEPSNFSRRMRNRVVESREGQDGDIVVAKKDILALVAEIDRYHASVTTMAAPAQPVTQVQQAAPSGWISVDEHMPAEGSKVLVSGPSYDDYAKGRYVSSATLQNGEFLDDNGDDLHTPSHWMPLPPAPGDAPAQPVGLSEQDSIDTPEFRVILNQWRLVENIATFPKSDPGVARCRKDLIDFINAAILAAKEAP